MSQLYESVVYFSMALDPIHVGTGGYRLGRVDLSIVREPGTNLPKIPGSSLSGTARAYAAIATGRYLWTDKDAQGSCSGQGQTAARGEGTYRQGHCGSPYCPICVAFGFARPDGGFRGLAQFSDGRVLFFPVHTMVGPVWITSPSSLADHGLEVGSGDDGLMPVAELKLPGDRLNLGWLMLPARGRLTLPDDRLQPVPNRIRQRAVLVPDKLFGQIVNDNLEVRTSVSIDPKTGAAEDGALFTYEALPRGTVLWFHVTYSDPQLFRIRWNGGAVAPQPRQEADKAKPALPSVRWVVERGLSTLEHLGVGGMNSRGMGRLEVLNLDAISPGEAGQGARVDANSGGRP